MYKINVIHIKIPGMFFCKNRKTLPNINVQSQETTKESKPSWLKKNKVGVLTLSVFKTFYKDPVIKRMNYWHEDNYIDQWNRTKRIEISRCYLVKWFLRRMSRPLWEKNSFSTSGAGKTGYTHTKEGLDPYLTPYITFNLNCIKDKM